LSPFQFGSQDIKKCVASADEQHIVFGFLARDTVTVVDRHAHLAVDAEVRLLLSGADHDLYLRRVTNDQGTMG
jgi:hypothetical protein